MLLTDPLTHKQLEPSWSDRSCSPYLLTNIDLQFPLSDKDTSGILHHHWLYSTPSTLCTHLTRSPISNSEILRNVPLRKTLMENGLEKQKEKIQIMRLSNSNGRRPNIALIWTLLSNRIIEDVGVIQSVLFQYFPQNAHLWTTDLNKR